MIEKTIRDFLKADKSLPICDYQYKENIEKQIVIERVGGELAFVSRSVFAFQVYGGSIANTAKISQKLAHKLSNIIELPEITSVKIGTIQNFTDTTRKKHRYQLIAEIYYYEREE